MSKVSEILANVHKENRKNLLEPEAKAICQEYNIPITRFKMARKKAEAARLAEEIGFPVVLKIVSPDIIHKSDIGGVMLNLKTTYEAEEAYKTILANAKKYQPNHR